MKDDFYIGYQKGAPRGLARFVAAAAAIIFAAVAITAGVIVWTENSPGDGYYAFGNPEVFEGTIRSVPVLHVALDAQAGGRVALLVGKGKHGAPDSIATANGKRVRLKATRIERDGTLMLETGGVTESPGDSAEPIVPPADLRTSIRFVGELVDSKCYLGVMNPGRGKVHRGCAAECLRGGVPPALLIHDENGEAHVVILTPADSAVPADPEWAARHVSATGALQRIDGIPVLTYTMLELAD